MKKPNSKTLSQETLDVSTSKNPKKTIELEISEQTN